MKNIPGLFLYFYTNFSFCYCRPEGYCFCQYGVPNFGFVVDPEHYCCQKSKEKCDMYTSYLHGQDVYCNGESLALTQQCNNDCNFYGFDVYRNYDVIRSYLDICKDNKYEFKSNNYLSSILLTINEYMYS